VSVEWAKQHHDLWYEQVKDQAAIQPADAAISQHLEEEQAAT